MKVAILVPNFVEFDGSARVAKFQAEELAQQGNEVAVFALAASMKPQGCALFVMGMPQSLFWQRIYRLLFPLDVLKVLGWLPRLKHFDEVIVHLYPLTWLACLAKRFYKVRYTFWYHGIMDPYFFPYLHERLYIRLQIFLTRLTVKNADRAVAVSKYAQEELKRYTGLNGEVVYNRVDLSKFHPGLNGTHVRGNYKLGNAPVMLFVGALRPVKGIHLLIQAFNLVKGKMPDARLVIVGSWDYPYYLEELKRLGGDSVIFAGVVPHDDLPYYYAMCDIYATCSLWETYNLPLVEAQLCGKPTVAFNIGPHQEVIHEKGVLVETGNAEKFAQACIQKLEQVRGARR